MGRSRGWWWPAWWPFHHRCAESEAARAMQDAEQSVERALRDREKAALIRAESEKVADVVRGHNVANRYDDWLATIWRGEAK